MQSFRFKSITLGSLVIVLAMIHFTAPSSSGKIIVRNREGKVIHTALPMTLAYLTNRQASIQINDKVFENWRGFGSVASGGAAPARAALITVVATGEGTSDPGPGLLFVSPEFSVAGIAQSQRTVFSYDVRTVSGQPIIGDVRLALNDFQAILAGELDVTETVSDPNQNLLGTLAVQVTSFGVSPPAATNRLVLASPRSMISVTKNIFLANGGREDQGNASLGQIGQNFPEPVAATISCVKLAQSADDLDDNPNDNHVLLPSDGNDHSVQYSISVTAGSVALTNVTINDSVLVTNGCTIPPPFPLDVGETKTFVLCSLPSNCGMSETSSCGNSLLGAASALGVLEVGSANVSVTGPSGVTGDVGIAPRGQLSVTGSSFVTGTVFLAANARYSKSGSGFVGSVVRNANLSQQISDALTAATNAAALTCSTSYRSLAPGLINGGPGLNVVCVQDIVINGGKVLTLNAPATASFVINVRGRFALTGGSKIRLAGGVSPENVLFNCIGTGEAVAFSGGVASATGASAVTGTLLAPEREVHLSPGYVQGSVISGMNINLTSGAKVTCSPSAPPLPPVVNIVTVTAISSFGPISNQCSATVECR